MICILIFTFKLKVKKLLGFLDGPFAIECEGTHLLVVPVHLPQERDPPRNPGDAVHIFDQHR